MTVDTLEIDFPFGMPEEEPVGLAVLGECWNPIGFPNDFPDVSREVIGQEFWDCVRRIVWSGNQPSCTAKDCRDLQADQNPNESAAYPYVCLHFAGVRF